MNVALEPVRFEDKAVLRRLLELYFYDASEFTGGDVNEHGEYGYRYFDNYWQGSDNDERWPYFIRVDGVLAGFVMVRRFDGVTDMAEFFVMRRFRRQAVGRKAARMAFVAHPGPWQVRELAANMAAQAFWRAVIREFTGGRFEESENEQGVTQRFEAIARG